MAKSKIKVVGAVRVHAKASEEYVDVIFDYGKSRWEGSIPVKYRRTGIDLNSQSEIETHLEAAYVACEPTVRDGWLKEQRRFWDSKPRAAVTRAFFDAMSTFEWSCIKCDLPPNPNWARRTQDIKEFGYTLSTNTARLCPKCENKGTSLLLAPLPRGLETGYETWSPAKRKQIMSVLGNYDAYEGKVASHLLPDHKFPEIRWDSDTKRHSLEDLTEKEIRSDFQLLTNQRNQQKREVCRSCFQTNKRGYLYGIPFFYHGSGDWPAKIPKTGKAAEAGCKGCGWYDADTWRQAIIGKLKSI
jgi:hypothetical protein